MQQYYVGVSDLIKRASVKAAFEAKEEILKKSLIEKVQEELGLFYVQIIDYNPKLDLLPIKPLLDALFEKRGKTISIPKAKYLISQSKVIGFFALQYRYDNRGRHLSFRTMSGFNGKYFSANDINPLWGPLVSVKNVA